MTETLKRHIENNLELLDSDEGIYEFVLSCPNTHVFELLEVLNSAKIFYPDDLNQIVGIFETMNGFRTSTDFLEEILRRNGANPDDSDPLLGYLKGMSDNQISNVFNEFKSFIMKKKLDGRNISNNLLKLYGISWLTTYNNI